MCIWISKVLLCHVGRSNCISSEPRCTVWVLFDATQTEKERASERERRMKSRRAELQYPESSRGGEKNLDTRIYGGPDAPIDKARLQPSLTRFLGVGLQRARNGAERLIPTSRARCTPGALLWKTAVLSYYNFSFFFLFTADVVTKTRDFFFLFSSFFLFSFSFFLKKNNNPDAEQPVWRRKTEEDRDD